MRPTKGAAVVWMVGLLKRRESGFAIATFALMVLTMFGAAGARASGIRGEILVIAYSPSTILVCQKRSPKKFQMLDKAYAAWLQKQPAEFIEFAKEVEAKQAEAMRDPQVQAHIKALEEMSPDALDEHCQGFVDIYKDLPQKPNPALATPERTWKTFQAAMLAKNRQSARVCLTSNALQNFRRIFERDDTKMGTWARDVKQFKISGEIGKDMVEAVVTTKTGRAYIVTLVKAGPNWLIAEM